MVRTILISGKAQAGKTAAANIIKDVLESVDFRVLIVPFAGYLKFIAKNYFGWDGKKDERGRDILQYVGTDVVRKNRPNFWVNSALDFVDAFSTEFDYFIFDDARFPNEIVLTKDRFPRTLSINLIRKDFENSLTLSQRLHPSETALDNFKAHDCVVISETGLPALKDALLTELNKEKYDWFFE